MGAEPLLAAAKNKEDEVLQQQSLWLEHPRDDLGLEAFPPSTWVSLVQFCYQGRANASDAGASPRL